MDTSLQTIYLEVIGANLELIRFMTDNFELLASRDPERFVNGHSGFTMYFSDAQILERLNRELTWDPQKITLTIGTST